MASLDRKRKSVDVASNHADVASAGIKRSRAEEGGIEASNGSAPKIASKDPKGPTGAATSAAAGSRPGAPSLSLDTLAKAKKALQMQKELKEKLKKLPQLKQQQQQQQQQQQTPAVATAAAAVSQPALLPTPTPGLLAPILPGALTIPAAAAGILPTLPGLVVPAATVPTLTVPPDLSSVLRAQELAARLGFALPPTAPDMAVGAAAAAALAGGLAGPAASAAVTAGAAKAAAKAPVLRLDAFGREIDEEGNVVEKSKTGPVSTLKVNINKAKKEAFKILRPELEEDPEESPFFDPRMRSERLKLAKPRRASFQFVEEGQFVRRAEAMRFKAQFGEAREKEMRAKQAALARGEAEEEAVNPNLIEVGERVVEEKKPKDPIPKIEWWDANILSTPSYPEEDSTAAPEIKSTKITIYVEHPVPIKPPAEAPPPPPQPLKLTKREQKKMRTQKRLAREKERQEMIRQGLLEPPKPKVKMSNLMRVLAAEATQDPTKMEKEVRAAAAEREQAHVDRNLARKLTPAEKREKKERKLFEDGIIGTGGGETRVCVFKVQDLSHPQTRFKVDINAQENRLTGCVVMADDFSLVVVEGGSKSVNRYQKLMMRRIDWSKAVKEGDDDDEDEKHNSCLLVWQGCVARAAFQKFTIHQCRTKIAARKFLEDKKVAHYWDLAENLPSD